MTTYQIKIDPELKALIPLLSQEELRQLEANIVEHGGARDPLVIWPRESHAVLLDGHNRYEICTRLGLQYKVTEMQFDTVTDAADWMDKNQLGRRNLHPDAFTLLLGRRFNRQKRQSAGAPPENKNKLGKNKGRRRENQLAQFGPIDSTAAKIGKEHGVGRNTVKRAGKFAEAVKTAKTIAPDIESKVASGKAPAKAAVMKAASLLETNPQKALEILEGKKKMADVVREEKRAEVIAKLESVEARTAKELAGEYDVLVIDPPWPMEKIERDARDQQVALDYPTMEEGELAKLRLPAAESCHVWLWVTHKFLPMSLRLLEAWGLKYVCTFVWHKPGGFQPFGLPQYNCEFAIYARKGAPQFIDTKAFFTCFDAPRGKHSEKPEEFYDVVRRVTAGRRIDIFNRRKIEGFDTWGKEAAE